MNSTTPWYKSKGILGSTGAIISGGWAAYLAYVNHDMNGVMLGLTAAFGGLTGLIGRAQATTTIGPVAK